VLSLRLVSDSVEQNTDDWDTSVVGTVEFSSLEVDDNFKATITGGISMNERASEVSMPTSVPLPRELAIGDAKLSLFTFFITSI